MKTVIFILFLAVALAAFVNATSMMKCGVKEVYHQCGGCDKTCENYKDKAIPCTLPCIPKCLCIEGLVRNSQGKCDDARRCNDKVGVEFKTDNMKY
ncbi:hypothetical protein B4U80_12618 [Leptotrombidium deliense]|uniref:TIL domain-containing protein n=1 Tax=Leptotrombidium deliense TaxID=299467 RepID=A0A443QPG7_9ACAR|nr:hypothetical protein B4U80_12618 [Leptotrombidium deliense]